MDKKVKVYTENGVSYQFDHMQMQTYFEMKRAEKMNSEKKVTKERFKQEMAENLGVSPETIKSWMSGINGPQDLVMVEQIAGYFEIDYHELLEKVEREERTEDMKFMEMASEKEKIMTKERVREVYEALVDSIDKTWKYFFTELYDSEWNSWQKERHENMSYEEAEDSCRRVRFLLIKYMLYIPKDLYKQINNLFWTVAEGVLIEAQCAFCDPWDEEDAEVSKKAISDLCTMGDEFEEVKFAERLRKVFADYIVE